MHILVDDENREKEGDLIFLQDVTADKINFMAKFGRGLICYFRYYASKKIKFNYMALKTSPETKLFYSFYRS